MPSVMRRASKILNEYGAMQSELIGKVVVLTDGKAGTVENVWLDELHGLRISIEGHDGRWPSQPSSSRRTRPSHRLRVAHIARAFQNIPIKMKRPTSVRKVTLMIATVRNTSLGERGLMNASHLAKPRQ
jgi:hypothetical protein